MTTATLEAPRTIETKASEAQTTTGSEWTATPEWMLAGKAEFTVHNAKGQHYSYQILKKEWSGKVTWLLTLLTGPDNDRDFTYVGVVKEDGSLHTTRASKVTTEAKSFKVAAWTLKKVWSGQPFPAGYGINHKGRCGRCGRALTRPEGIDPKGWRYGFGEVCYSHIQSEREKRATAPQHGHAAPAEPTAEERMAEAVARLEARMRATDRAAKAHPANRHESWDERERRANREAIEEQEARVGFNPLY